MRSLPKVTFVVDNFVVGSPDQQLLDRFLIGYNRDGEFYSPRCQVEVMIARANDAIVARAKEFALKVTSDLANAQAIVVMGSLQLNLAKLPRDARCFVYGPIAQTSKDALESAEAASGRGIALRSGTAILGAFQLPPIDVPSRVQRGLAVTYGAFPNAELEAVEALWALGAAPTTAPKLELLTGSAVWQAAYSSEWNDLFTSAFSRSNTIQGDPVLDGRTQDVAGMRLVEKLVSEPRAWLLEADGKRAAVFVLNGALEDLNMALQGVDGKIVSTQLYRPPPPMEDHFSGLAGRIEDFFRADTAPKPDAPTLLLPGVFEAMRTLRRARGASPG